MKSGFGCLATLTVALTLCCSAAISQTVAGQPSPNGAAPAAQTGGVAVSDEVRAAFAGARADHISISVANVEKEAAWYQQVLGFKYSRKDDRNPDRLLITVVLPTYRLELIQYKGSTRPAAATPNYMHQGLIHIGLEVPDLAAALKSLKASNTDVVTGHPDAAGNPGNLIVHDPEGNEIMIQKPPAASAK